MVAARDSEVVAVVSVGVAGAAPPNVARGASVVVAARGLSPLSHVLSLPPLETCL